MINELIRKNVEGSGHDLIFWHLIGVTEEDCAQHQDRLSQGQDVNTRPSKFENRTALFGRTEFAFIPIHSS